MNENQKINKDLLQKITIIEFALEESIKQFDYSNNKKWIEKYHSHSIECYDGKEWKSYNFEIFKLVVKDFLNNLFK